MPQVRKLGPEEVQALQNKGKGTRKLTEELYDTILSEYQTGDYGEAELEEGENRLTVRNRLKAAAKRRQLSIDFKRTSGNTIRFQVANPAASGTSSAVSSDAPPEAEPAKRKGGRPKKSA